jgi:multiple sugar transport system substrate-binding protein
MFASLRLAIVAGLLAITSGAPPAKAQQLVFVSTQLRPVEEAEKVRRVLLRGAPATSFIVDDPPAFTARIRLEQESGNHTISLVGALHGELQAVAQFGALEAIDGFADSLKGRGIPAELLELGKFGGQKQLYIPWMQATYVLVVKKQAMPFLPSGADINALTYDQLTQWAKTIAEKTGQRRLGFPAGPKGLFARFLQGYLYPSYTGSMVSEFRSLAAEKMWMDFKELWASVNPKSLSYDFMQDPLQAGEVWIAWDHVSRVKDAVQASPGDYQVVPPPAGPRGRAYVPVIVGLAVVNGAPDRAGAATVIAHLEQPDIQITTAVETGFFPVVAAELPAGLSPGIKLLAEGVAKTQNAKDALVVLLPIGIGDNADAFSAVFTDTFQRIVLRGEPMRATLDAQASVMRTIVSGAKAPCWKPDQPSTGPCPVN